MIDKSKFDDLITSYKQDFLCGWFQDEKYKWQAVKHFQTNWNLNASNFAEMLEASFAKSSNLLASHMRYPLGMLKEFSANSPEQVRAMFASLYDESLDIFKRVKDFAQQATEISKLQPGKSHYQDENSISTYLWLKFPDKYYIYKWSEVRNVSRALETDFRFKKGDRANNLRDQMQLYDKIRTELTKDSDLKGLLTSQITEDCYADPQLVTLTIDFGYYVSKLQQKLTADTAAQEENISDWWPPLEEYNPGLTVDDWYKLLQNPEVFTKQSLQIMRRLKEIGGSATCLELAQKFGENSNFYNSGSQALSRRILQTAKIPTLRQNNVRLWPVLYLGRPAQIHQPGDYVWRLRDELSEALDRVDLSVVPLYSSDINVQAETNNFENYSRQDFLDEVYLSAQNYDRLVNVLRRKKNIILQGAPGVGKTYAAKRLAWSMLEEKNSDKIELIQFHQNYSYEDFMMGYKPDGNGFALKHGIFYKFCKKAVSDPHSEYFFIIDEINRGNMSKIFGELLMLIENDHRGEPLRLAYNDEEFAVPANVYIIGMMNTADRSLALIDYALRRRFSFIEMTPGFQTQGFKRYQQGLNHKRLNAVIETVQRLNEEIAIDPLLGKGFAIGHSYFTSQLEVHDYWLKSVIEYDILPMLEEYWFDDNEKLERWQQLLTAAVTEER